MNKERYNQIIDEVYEKYIQNTPENHVIGSDSDPLKLSMVWKRKIDSSSGYPILERLTQEEFINNCKIDSVFSEKWGLKIEERELSDEESVSNGVNSYWWNSDTGMTLIWFVGIYLIFCPIVAYIISNCVN